MTRPRKLLIWTENYWIGGCDRFLVDLIEGIRHRPVEVALAGNPHPEFDVWLARRLPWLGPRTTIPVANLVQTPLHRLGRRVRPAPQATAPDAGPAADGALPGAADSVGVLAAIAAARYGQASLNLARLRALVGRARPDALLINNGGYPGGESCRVMALAAHAAGVRRIVHFVHNMAHEPAWPQPVERAFDARVDAALDCWVTAAHRASDALSAQRGIPRDRVQTVHYGLPAVPEADVADPVALRAELGFTAGRPHLVAVANFEPRKGLSVLLSALTELRAAGVEIETVLVGDGPERGRLAQQITQVGLTGQVRMLGWRDDVDAIMRQADALVLPSLANECLPYVILEAMQHRLPVVATDVAGIPEMVADGVTGRVVAPGDASALGAALRAVFADPSGARAMGARGQERVQARFGLEQMVGRMSSLLGLS